ncbi:MAG: hypothetical protein ACLRMZ_26060 [Blautia marasmi]
MGRKWKVFTGLVLVGTMLAGCTPGTEKEGDAAESKTETTETKKEAGDTGMRLLPGKRLN